MNLFLCAFVRMVGAGAQGTAWQPDGSIHQCSPVWALGALPSSLMPPGGFHGKNCTILTCSEQNLFPFRAGVKEEQILH